MLQDTLQCFPTFGSIKYILLYLTRIFFLVLPLFLLGLAAFISFLQIVPGLLWHSFTSAASFLLWIHFRFVYSFTLKFERWLRARNCRVAFDVQIAQIWAVTDRPVLIFVSWQSLEKLSFLVRIPLFRRVAHICQAIIRSKRRSVTWRDTIKTNSSLRVF